MNEPGRKEENAPCPPMKCDVFQADPKYACKRYACAIQDCLARNDYNQRKCGHVIQELVECCKYQGADSVHCQGFGL